MLILSYKIILFIFVVLIIVFFLRFFVIKENFYNSKKFFHELKNNPHLDHRFGLNRKLNYNEFNLIYMKLSDFYNSHCHKLRINNYNFLDWPEIKEMADNGIDFGYHSNNHFILTKLPIKKLYDELKLPENIAMEQGVKLKKIFCYPDCQYNSTIIKILHEMNYIGATSLITGYNTLSTNPFTLKRINLHEDISSTLPTFLSNIGIKFFNK